jgi:hypothetical protein
MEQQRPLSEEEFNAIAARVAESAPPGLSESDFDALINAEIAKGSRSLLQRLTGDPGGAGLSPSAKNSLAQINADGPAAALLEGATQGLGQGIAGPVGKAVGGFLKRGAVPLMRLAQGPQSAVASKFPTVDVAKVALREGVGAKDVAQAGRLGKEAARVVRTAADAADSTGAPKITRGDIVKGLRPVYDKAVAAERGGVAGEKDRVMKIVADIRRQMPKEGLSVRESLIPKSRWQRLASPKYAAQPGQQVATDPEIAEAVAKSFASAARDRGMGDALTRSQELMALQRATQASAKRPSMLRNLMGLTAGAGVGAGTGDPIMGAITAAVPMMAMSPTGLSTAARALHRGGEPVSEALLRMLASHAVSPKDEE